MTNAMKKVWQFKGYFTACAIYSVTCTIMMIEPLLGIWLSCPRCAWSPWLSALFECAGANHVGSAFLLFFWWAVLKRKKAEPVSRPANPNSADSQGDPARPSVAERMDHITRLQEC